MSHLETIHEIAERVMPALNLFLQYLEEGIATVDATTRAGGLDPEADTATFNANVRQYVRTRMRSHVPLPAVAPMSPLHLDLGPYQLKVLHAEDGSLPRPRTDARKGFYAASDSGLFSLNVTPPDGLMEIDEGVTEIEEGSLVLVWDSSGPDLTQADLYRTSLENWPGERLDLLAATAVEEEEDFEGVRKADEKLPDAAEAGGAEADTPADENEDSDRS